MNCVKNDEVSQPAKILELKTAFLELTGDVKFKKSKNRGEILVAAIDFVIRNYKNENPFLR
jgi:hypothetical protein